MRRVTISSSVPDDGSFALSVSVSADHPRATLIADLTTAMAGAQPNLDGERAVQVWLEDADRKSVV